MTEGLDAKLAELDVLLAAIKSAHGSLGLEAARRRCDTALDASRATNGAAKPGESTLDRSRYANIIGDSKPLRQVFAVVDRVAASAIAILIQGESGTGKELIARAIHRNSPRRDQPFVTENCAAIPETLLESELFGYKRGAFTGADRERKGLFEAAHKGTLFLDEVGDMSLGMQKKLLRALQDGEIRPVGGTASVHVDVRIVSASNRQLKDLVAQGRFREDLYYRLNGVTIELPPLRDRADDIPALARWFLQKVAAEMGREAPLFSGAAEQALCAYRWPGNVRELENEMRRCLALLGGERVIQVEHLSEEVRSAAR